MKRLSTLDSFQTFRLWYFQFRLFFRLFSRSGRKSSRPLYIHLITSLPNHAYTHTPIRILQGDSPNTAYSRHLKNSKFKFLSPLTALVNSNERPRRTDRDRAKRPRPSEVEGASYNFDSFETSDIFRGFPGCTADLGRLSRRVVKTDIYLRSAGALQWRNAHQNIVCAFGVFHIWSQIYGVHFTFFLKYKVCILLRAWASPSHDSILY